MKKNNKLKIIIVFLLLIFLSGCARPLRDENKKVVKYEKTGQNLTANILCRPTNNEVIGLYEEKGIKIETLVECSDFKINTGGYEGLWTSFFVKPLAFIILKIGMLVKNYGLALIILGILLRLVINPITKKSTIQSENLKKAKPELDAIERKYKGKNDQESTMKKTQEVLMIYKKYEINPLTGCLFAIVQLPLLFAFLEAINRVPAIFEEKLLTIQLGTTTRIGLFKHGNILYGILLVLMILATYYTFNINMSSTNEEQVAQKKITLIFMVVSLTLISLGLPSAISLYWVTSNAFTIVQNLLIKRRAT